VKFLVDADVLSEPTKASSEPPVTDELRQALVRAGARAVPLLLPPVLRLR
jgi:hypothetical protein